MKHLIKIVFLLCASTLIAQHTAEGKLPAVEESGLHKILIPHTLRSFSKKDLRDVRIWDSKGIQVPYFIHTNEGETIISNFSEYTIVEKSKRIDTSSTYVFENPKKEIQKAVLFIANYQGSKRYDVLGSYDQKQWFGLVNSQYISNLKSNSKTSIAKVISFPLCSYKYLKIVFNDKGSLPINVLKIGAATNETIRAAMQEIPVKTTTISDVVEEKKTQIHISFEHPEIIDQINFTISDPKLYNRKAQIYTLKTREVKHKVETYKQQLERIRLSSDGINSFGLSHFFEKELYIEIENEDNPKLAISNIQLLQRSIYLMADLKENEAYTVSAGDQKLSRPQYDISYFKEKVSEDLPNTNIVEVSQTKLEEAIEKPVSFWQNPWFMWLCIGIATLVIAFFASSLIKDMSKES